jgi:L-asparaginase/Glu-tRNA(Gln) amidotransferase subunit D
MEYVGNVERVYVLNILSKNMTTASWIQFSSVYSQLKREINFK